jgi:hypothetical protein
VQALGQATLPANQPADPQQVEHLPFLLRDNVIERVDDLSAGAGTAGEPYPEVTLLNPAQSDRDLVQYGAGIHAILRSAARAWHVVGNANPLGGDYCLCLASQPA